MNSVLVPLDFSDATPKVLDMAAQVADSFKARMMLLHVVEPISEYVPLAASMDVLTTPVPASHPWDPHPLIERLERLAQPFRGKGLIIDCEVQAGLAIDVILKRVQSSRAEMIVLGSHGHGALYHLFTGGVATGVLKKTSTPVLIVPTRDLSVKA